MPIHRNTAVSLTSAEGIERIVRPSNVTVGEGISLLAALALSILIFVPFSPSFPLEQLDASWRYATNYALGHGFQFGKDVIFTSGPLSFLYTRQYYPGCYALTLVLSTLIIAAVMIGGWSVARRSRRTLILALPLLLAQAPDFDAVFLFVPLILLWVVCQSAEGRAKTALLIFLTALCALLPLVKGSFAVAVLALCAAAFVLDVRYRPLRGAGLAGLFAATLSVAWLACGQAPSTFADYVASEAQIVSGYTDAMSQPGPAWQPILFALAAVAILALGSVGLYRRTIACVLSLALTLFLCFKAGFVRQDGHVLIASSALLLAGLLVTLAGRGRAASMALPLGMAAWCLISWPYAAVDIASDVERAADAAGRSAGAIHALATDRGGGRRRFDEALAGVHARHPLDVISGTADLYPTDVAVVLANGLDWAPRPVIQSYSAYTNQLAELNAESLARPGAPDTILFQVASIDGRYPALDDGRSWPALAARYRPVGRRGEYVELQKRGTVAETGIGASVVDREVGLGEKVAIPSGPIWAEIDLAPTATGRLVSAAYKLPLLTLTIKYMNGSSRDFRFIASVGKAGFLLSPTVEKAATLLALESPSPSFANAGVMPASFSISADDRTGWLWQSHFRVVLRPIAFPKADDVDSILFTQIKPFDGDLPSAIYGDCAIDEVAGQDGDDVRLAAATGSLSLRGWGMMSAERGESNRGLSMVFVPEGAGTAFSADLPKIASPGLVEHFRTPAAGDAGFDADVDVRSLPAGRYHLQLVQDGVDGAVQCSHRVIVVERR